MEAPRTLPHPAIKAMRFATRGSRPVVTWSPRSCRPAGLTGQRFVFDTRSSDRIALAHASSAASAGARPLDTAAKDEFGFDVGMCAREAVYVALMAQVGCALRLLVSELASIPTFGAEIGLPANLLGCLLMGLLANQHVRKNGVLPDSATRPLMTGLRIGLCGSLTTFAAWQAGLIIAIHGNTWSFLEGLGEVFLAQGAGVCAPYLFLALGRKIAQLLPATSDRAGIRTVPEVRPVATAPAGGRSQDLPGASGASHGQFDGVVVFAGPALALALWECVCVLNGSKPADPTGRLWAWSLIFAPIGAMIRWRLASSNKAGRIPWGTFTANIVATSVACLCFGALASAVVGSNVIPAEERIILSAIAIGFCGSLSTVSTLLTEVQAMRQGRQAGGKKGGGMRYLLLSLTTALVAGNFFFELGSISGTSLIKSLGTIVVLSLKYLFSFL